MSPTIGAVQPISRPISTSLHPLALRRNAVRFSPASDFVIEIRRFLTHRWEAVGLTLRRVWDE